jgi:hypothetical protein
MCNRVHKSESSSLNAWQLTPLVKNSSLPPLPLPSLRLSYAESLLLGLRRGAGTAEEEGPERNAEPDHDGLVAARRATPCLALSRRLPQLLHELHCTALAACNSTSLSPSMCTAAEELKEHPRC